MMNETFIGKAIGEMIASGISVKFTKRIYKSKYSYPMFIPPPHAELDVNYFVKEKPDDWIHTFIHEYAHYLQWKLEHDKWGGHDKYSISLNGYFEDKNRKRVAKKCIRKVQEIEIDGGLKVAELIKTYRLPIDRTRYFKENNLYILCHEAMAKYRRFDIPYHLTDKLFRYIPVRPLTMETLESFKYLDKIEACYQTAYAVN